LPSRIKLVFGWKCAEDGNQQGQPWPCRMNHDLNPAGSDAPKVDGPHRLPTVNAGRTQRRVPILMITAMGENPDKVSGFNSGADDYSPKPFLILRSLLARVKGPAAPHRGARFPTKPNEILSFGPLTLGVSALSRLVRQSGAALTRLEFNLFCNCLLQQPTRPCRATAADPSGVWGLRA